MPLLPDGAIDTLGVLDAVLATPEAVAAAASAAIDVPPNAGVRGMVLVASGDDAIVGEAVLALLEPLSPVPVFLHTGHGLPAFVSDEWRCVFLSRQPTAEARSALRAAVDHRAVLTAVGSGEVVETVAERDGDVVRSTDDAPAARFAFAPTLVTALRLLDGLGAVAAPLGTLPDALDAAVAQLGRRRGELDVPSSEAARLARRIGRTLPLVHGASPLGRVAARRWAQQVNANVKAAAFAAALPALGHHELAGWGQHGDVTRQVFSLVSLRHDHEHADDARLVPTVDELVEEVVHARHEVRAEGDGPLAQLLDLVFVGDLVSYHLAQENEIDPGPVAVRDRLGMVGP
ncbi:MAG: SIS domain-containing protein [Acidimicrobiia bacterium]